MERIKTQYEFITIDDLERMGKKDRVEVNSNRVYSKIAEMGRRSELDQTEKNIYETLVKNSKIKLSDCNMYITMSAEDASLCFDRTPYLNIRNTFRRCVSEKDKKLINMK